MPPDLPVLPPDPTLGDLPPDWCVNAYCGNPACGMYGSTSVWNMVGRHGEAIKVAALAARFRCRHCGSRAGRVALEDRSLFTLGGGQGVPERSIPLFVENGAPINNDNNNGKTPAKF